MTFEDMKRLWCESFTRMPPAELARELHLLADRITGDEPLGARDADLARIAANRAKGIVDG